MRGTISIFAFTLALLFTGFTPVPVFADVCASLVRPQAILLEFEAKATTGDFGREPVATLDRSIRDLGLREKLLAMGRSGVFPVTLIKMKFKEGTAYFYYREIAGTDAIVADMVEVPEKLRGQRISELLLTLAFSKLTHINRVVFYLDQTNRDFFYNEPDLPLVDRLRGTPAYKSFSKLGFTEIELVAEVLSRRGEKMFPHAILRRPAL